MKIFMLKSFLILSIMFISVLAGMQMASGGIQKLKGSTESQAAVSLNEQIPATASEKISSHDLEAKQKKLEEMTAYNFFSSMGKKMSDGISKTSEKIIERITK